MTVEQVALTSKTSFGERPGTDKIRKAILKHPFVKNIITSAILDVEGDKYRVIDAEWSEGSKTDVLYEPLDKSLNQPPIIIEVQKTVDDSSMVRAAFYCVMAYRRYQVFPIIIIFAIGNVSISTEHMRTSNACGALSFNCEYWAKKGYLIRLRNVPEITDSSDPFAAVSAFILQQKISLMENDSLKNSTMKRLFSIAIEFLQENVDQEQQSLEDSPGIQNEALPGTLGSKQVKRTADDANMDEGEPESSLPENQDEERFQNTMNFVQQYKETRKRMSWRGCYDTLKEQTNVTRYKNPEVLRVIYSRFKKNS